MPTLGIIAVKRRWAVGIETEGAIWYNLNVVLGKYEGNSPENRTANISANIRQIRETYYETL